MMALQLATPTPAPYYGTTTFDTSSANSSAYRPSDCNTSRCTPSTDDNLAQFSEEIEGMVMLSLLKQKYESFNELVKLSPRRQVRSYEEENESDHDIIDEDEYGRGRRRNAPSSQYGSYITSSPSRTQKRRKEEEEEATYEISSRNSWMENFAVVKRITSLPDHDRRPIEVIQMNEWVEQQQNLYNRRMLSEERIELLNMIGVDLDGYMDQPSSPDPVWDDDDDDLSSSGKEQSPPLRPRKRNRASGSPSNSAPNSAPSSPLRTRKIATSFVDIKDLNKRPKKKKANLKRNSLHNWVYNQRRLQYEGNLPIHRKKLLDKIGFDWKWVQQKIDQEKSEEFSPEQDEEVFEPIPNSKSEELWMTRYRELISFKEKHGHYEVPRYVE